MPAIRPMFRAVDCDLVRLADVTAVDLAAVVAAHVTAGRFAIGGYGETRRIYGAPGYPPSLHLGLDVWGRACDTVIAPVDGGVVDLVDHAGAGDFGPTLTIRAAADGVLLRIAHLSRESLATLHVGEPVEAGEVIGRMGSPVVNGGWPPHVHVQVITALDDPGVVPTGIEGGGWLRRCPDPARWVLG